MLVEQAVVPILHLYVRWNNIGVRSFSMIVQYTMS